MNLTFDDYVKELGIEGLSQEDKVVTITSFARTVHTQFLSDLHESLPQDSWNAIKTSIKLGAPLYVTTLKHVVPDYMEIYEKAKQKVLEKMHSAPAA